MQIYLPTQQKTIISSNKVSRWAINDSYVSDLYLDDQNLLWVGTYSNGINKANLNGKRFDYFYHDPLNNNSIVDNDVRAICEDKSGNLWIGTRNEGITIVGKNKTYQTLKHNNKNKSSINSDQIRKIFCDSRGWIWIGMKNGIDRYDQAGGSIRHHELMNLNKTGIFDIMEDRTGDIWLATWKGIYQYIVKKDQWVHFDPVKTLPMAHARVIIEDHTGQLWVGTDGGGISLLRKTNSGVLAVVKQFRHHGDSRNTLSDGRIYSLLEDTEHFVWIGTGNGLNRFDPARQIFKHFSMTDERAGDDWIAAILEDDLGSIWLSHKKGLSQLNKRALSVTNYSLNEGLQSNEFEEASAFKSAANKKLYFGGNNGYNVFFPKDIVPDQNLPQVVFTELQVLNKPVEINKEVNGKIILKKPIYLTKQIELNHRDKSIALEFSGLEYTNPAGNKYAYMLEGFDKDWVYVDASRRFATYSNLDPGEYTFRVKASNSDGIWNPKPTTLKIKIIPAFWASTWAYVFYILIFAGLLYLFYYYSASYAGLRSKLAYESLIHEKELELHKNKIEFFTNISHEIKTPLSLILAPIEYLMSVTKLDTNIDKQLRTMKNNGDRLLKLINQLLDIRRFETGNDQLNLEKKDLVSFLSAIVESFQQIAEQRGITLHFVCATTPFYMFFDSDKTEKILYNLLSNSFKFTQKGGVIQVRINQTQNDPSLFATIEVIDNGIGILPADLERIFKPFQQGKLNKTGGTGLGLAYSKALAELQGGMISVQSITGKGTHNYTNFTLTLPTYDATGKLITDNETTPLFNDADNADLSNSLQLQTTANTCKLKTILLIEDNFELRRYLRDHLAGCYEVLEAADGQVGFEMATRYHTDLIISDIMMPEIDGIALSRQLKSDLITSHIPIILLTARTTVEDQIEGLETGADDYIVKPFNLKLLSLKINNLLVNQERLRERYKAQVTVNASAFKAVSPDEKLLKKILTYVEDHLSDPDLNIENICDSAGLSRTNLYRKMKALTGLSVAEFIKKMRLNRSQDLLKDRKFNVSEVCYMVGFTDAEYFRKCFKAEFGISPSEYAKTISAQQV